MNRNEYIESVAKQTLENAGHTNVAVKCTKLSEGGPGATSRQESAGTWSASSDGGSFSFSLTHDEYNSDLNEVRIMVAMIRGLTKKIRGVS